MKRAREGEKIRTAFDLARELRRRLDAVGARRPAEHEFVIKPARLQNLLLKRLHKIALCRSVHVKRVRHAAFLDVFDDRRHDRGVVVAVVERARPRKKVQILMSLLVGQHTALRGFENAGEIAAVRPHGRLFLFKNRHRMNLLLVLAHL